jgi:hypothetical protein
MQVLPKIIDEVNKLKNPASEKRGFLVSGAGRRLQNLFIA